MPKRQMTLAGEPVIAAVSHPYSKHMYPNQTRAALNTYIVSPEENRDRVSYFDDKFVILHDKFPKSFVHLLVMPRSLEISSLHPVEALSHPDLLHSIQPILRKAMGMVCDELHDRKGGIWFTDRDVKVGVHAAPSMDNVHVHVMSRDMCSDSMKRKAHYNSFNTPFLVPVPTDAGSHFSVPSSFPFSHTLLSSWINQDLICWACRTDFSNRFAELKRHLYDEFDRLVAKRKRLQEKENDSEEASSDSCDRPNHL